MAEPARRHLGSHEPVVLSLGMGVDSVAILTRWIHEPACRDFDLADLVVLTAMTGDEFDATRALMEDRVLPLMRRHGLRYVQLARAGQATACRYVVLDDSRAGTNAHARTVVAVG